MLCVSLLCVGVACADPGSTRRVGAGLARESSSGLALRDVAGLDRDRKDSRSSDIYITDSRSSDTIVLKFSLSLGSQCTDASTLARAADGAEYDYIV